MDKLLIITRDDWQRLADYLTVWLQKDDWKVFISDRDMNYNLEEEEVN